MLRYREIKLQLKKMIDQLPANGKLPSRAALCKELDTTRSTLAKAMKELQDEGFVISKEGSGTYASQLLKIQNSPAGSFGVIVPNIMESIYPGLVRGIENVCEKQSIGVTLCNSDDNMEKQSQYIRRLILSGISGFIIVPVISNDLNETLQLYSLLNKKKIPFVFCNRIVDGIEAPVVTSNSFYGGYIATKHLLDRGYRSIAYISTRKYSTSLERCYGYVSALEERGNHVRDEWMILRSMDQETPGYDEIKAILSTPDRPDALFCFNDRIAKVAYQVAGELNIAIPSQLGVIGYDNDNACDMFSPPLTSVSYRNIEIGERAAEILIRMVKKEPVSQCDYILFQPQIVERDSCVGPGGA